MLADEDAEDEDECGRLLVTSTQGWRTEVAKWIGDARAAKMAKDSDSDADDEVLTNVPWKKTMLAQLFGGIPDSPCNVAELEASAEFSAEHTLMQALADMEENNRPDEGAIEVDSEEEYIP